MPDTAKGLRGPQDERDFRRGELLAVVEWRVRPDEEVPAGVVQLHPGRALEGSADDL